MQPLHVVMAWQAYEKASHLVALLDETVDEEIVNRATANMDTAWLLYVKIKQEVEGF